jgi:probable DNA metabolism protein
MPAFLIQSIPGFEEWKTNARNCLAQGVLPSQTQWQSHYDDANLNLFAENLSLSTNTTPPGFVCHPVPTDILIRRLPPRKLKLSRATAGESQGGEFKKDLKVPRSFMELAQIVICHNSPERFALLYRVVWRLLHENRLLLDYQTDSDIIQLAAMAKAVRRDAYKIKAFLRFREVLHHEKPHFVAWYEPEHYTLEHALPFFQERFKNMSWSILTPYRSAHWDGEKLLLTETSDKALYPTEDAVEAYWVQYYASIFNPARLKTKAMLNQMPKKYWKHMPETAQIESLIRNASLEVEEMISKQKTQL